ncbi:MAG: undecaprenyl-diphosphatase UppP [Patescibacteria group bacterium]
MTLLHSLILSLVEGITEFLPVSSTGHLIVAAKLLGLETTVFNTSFEIFIQLGAILAVVALYGKSFLRDRAAWQRVAAAFVPTALIGLALFKIIKETLLTDPRITVWALGIGGVALILFEWWHARRPQEARAETVAQLSWQKAMVVGLFQSLSIVPGVSRAAATIIGGLVMGWNRKTAVEFSFLLAAPTMLAASGLDLLKSGTSFSGQELSLLAAGFICSFSVALVVVKWFVRFIARHTFIPFGVYRILAALAFVWAMW